MLGGGVCVCVSGFIHASLPLLTISSHTLCSYLPMNPSAPWLERTCSPSAAIRRISDGSSVEARTIRFAEKVRQIKISLGIETKDYDARGVTGERMAVTGFGQDAKPAASLL